MSAIDLAPSTSADRAAQAERAYVDTIAVDDDTHLVLPAGTIAHYGNHSCDPTTWLSPPFELVARRDLAADTELTIDYRVVSDDPTFQMECRCGASGCRQVVTGSDWRLPTFENNSMRPLAPRPSAPHRTSRRVRLARPISRTHRVRDRRLASSAFGGATAELGGQLTRALMERGSRRRPVRRLGAHAIVGVGN